MTPFLAAFTALVALCWGIAPSANPVNAPYTLWALRQDALNLTGLWSISLMSLAMILATRPTCLERAFNGMDKIYRNHKRAGILAIAFAVAHWLVEMASDPIKTLIGRTGRLPKEHADGFLEIARDFAKDLGEWAIYVAIAMLAITLWKRFPFNAWRTLHKLMPIVYLTLAFHAAVLMPFDYWSQPVGVLVALLISAGTIASVHILAGRVGRTRRHVGRIAEVTAISPEITEVICTLDATWPPHRAGQFAFVTFSPNEGAHPFTIANAAGPERSLTFQIKGLGDYTTGLAKRLRLGQPVLIEGPYGCFERPRPRSDRAQIWIAGGIGITPFLAWLDELVNGPENSIKAHLYYCVSNRDTDPFVPRLEAAHQRIHGLSLSVISSDRDTPLDAAMLATHNPAQADIWFCGPQALAKTLNAERQAIGFKGQFHQEAFEMR